MEFFIIGNLRYVRSDFLTMKSNGFFLFVKSVNRYLNLTTENYMRQMISSAAGGNSDASPTVLQVEHIFGPLAMLAIGVIVATLTFLGEHIYYHTHRVSRKRIIDLKARSKKIGN